MQGGRAETGRARRPRDVTAVGGCRHGRAGRAGPDTESRKQGHTRLMLRRYLGVDLRGALGPGRGDGWTREPASESWRVAGPSTLERPTLLRYSRRTPAPAHMSLRSRARGKSKRVPTGDAQKIIISDMNFTRRRLSGIAECWPSVCRAPPRAWTRANGWVSLLAATRSSSPHLADHPRRGCVQRRSCRA